MDPVAQGAGEVAAKIKSGEVVAERTPIGSRPRAVAGETRKYTGPASLDLWAAVSTMKWGQEPGRFH